MFYLIVLVIGVVLGWYIRKTAEVGEPRGAPAKEIPGSLSVRCPKCRATFRFGTHLWCTVREIPEDKSVKSPNGKLGNPS